MVPICNPNTQKVEARKSGVQGHPWVHSKLASLRSDMNPVPTKKHQGSGYVVQSEEFLSMHETLGWTPALYKPGEL